MAGGPLRAEDFPKRRCRFESVAAKPHLRPRKGRRSQKPAIIPEWGFNTNLTAGRQPQLSVLATVLRLPLVGT